VSAIFEDQAAKESPATEGGGTGAALRVTIRVPYLMGMGLSLIGWILSLIALQSLPLFAVQAIASSSIGVVVLLDWVRTRRPLPGSQIALLVVLGIGLVALAVAAQPSGPGTIPSAFDVAIWIGVVVLGAAWLLLDRTGAGARTSVLLGTVSGLAYGGTSLCARALEGDATLRGVLFDPLTVALLPFAVVGVGSFAAALQRGSVSIIAACQHAAMTVVPAAVGLAFLGDSARDGFAAIAAVGFVLTLAAVIALTFVKPARAADAVVPAV
jgi:hypothetical protein